jgi:hypothetical protein
MEDSSTIIALSPVVMAESYLSGSNQIQELSQPRAVSHRCTGGRERSGPFGSEYGLAREISISLQHGLTRQGLLKQAKSEMSDQYIRYFARTLVNSSI